METIKRINELTDNEQLALYHGFLNFVMSRLTNDPLEILEDLPEELKRETELDNLLKANLEDLETRIEANEVLPVAKEQLQLWAEDEILAPLLEEYMDSNPIKAMAAGTILAFGAVLLVTIVSTSLKVEVKDGKTSISYSSSNISDNAVEIVKAVMGKVPETIQHIYSKIKS
ncbi:hypothetical protein [uncultured Draconibacterium sp.]|uniref:hypothetical protein n=1 Tax=uncultured Draconibacterium sp. TaxID=1573823 RepID=UPI0029C735CA|nr:hypothetical protein [uncultured Draconibacterium sp.]